MQVKSGRGSHRVCVLGRRPVGRHASTTDGRMKPIPWGIGRSRRSGRWEHCDRRGTGWGSAGVGGSPGRGSAGSSRRAHGGSWGCGRWPPRTSCRASASRRLEPEPRRVARRLRGAPSGGSGGNTRTACSSPESWAVRSRSIRRPGCRWCVADGRVDGSGRSSGGGGFRRRCPSAGAGRRTRRIGLPGLRGLRRERRGDGRWRRPAGPSSVSRGRLEGKVERSPQGMLSAIALPARTTHSGYKAILQGRLGQTGSP